ncbi:hypothetical protein BSKO_01268 [Bryopsis sp. KO-2023]|nr:hypothetical protein BSKO_01268 [Bryopsis sp. KO-2023]
MAQSGFRFHEYPPGLSYAPGSFAVEGFELGGEKVHAWPSHPPGVEATQQEAQGTVDDADVLLGRRNEPAAFQNLQPSQEIVAHNQYDELYEAPNLLNFDGLGLSEPLLEGVYVEMQFEKPSKIQALTLPSICTPPYPSLVAQAQNGCGKTCCFALCILSRLEIENRTSPQAMVVVPTRELAIQNASVIAKMGKRINVTVLSTSETDRLHAESEASPGSVFITEHVIVGTHGNLRIFRRKAWLSFENLKVVVLDEADHMIDREGFRDDTTLMMRYVDQDVEGAGNPRPQLLMFSATYREDIKDFAKKLFDMGNRESHKIWIPKEELNLDKIKQVKVECWGYEEKVDVLMNYILTGVEKMGKSIIFVRYREAAQDLHNYLLEAGWPATAISGAMEYHQRDAVIQEFRDTVTNILVSTDVLSRGFDVSDVSLVVNFDVPVTKDGCEPAYETYLHRVGRTGRFKRKGAAFNLINMTRPEASWFVQQIEDYFGKDIPALDVRDEHALNTFLDKAGLTEYRQDA